MTRFFSVSFGLFLSLWVPVASFAYAPVEVVGTWSCVDKHDYWTQKNMRVAFTQTYRDNGTGTRFYNVTDYEQGVVVNFLIEHDWSITGDEITHTNYSGFYFDSTNSRLLANGAYVIPPPSMADTMKQVIRSLFPIPKEPVSLKMKKTNVNYWITTDDRINCYRLKPL